MNGFPAGFPAAEIVLRGFPLWAGALAAALLLAVSVRLYRRDCARYRRKQAACLLALRTAAALVLTVLLVDPVLARRKEVREPGEVVVLADTSASMGLADPPDRPASRLERVRAALAGGVLERLRASRRVVVAPFASEVGAEVTFGPGRQEGAPPPILGALPERPSGSTDLAAALAHARKRVAPGRLEGVILITDGRHHGYTDPRVEARALGKAGIPVIAVLVGPREDPADAWISHLEAPAYALSGDAVAIAVGVAVAGGVEVERASVRVRAGGKVLARREVELERAGRTRQVYLAFAPEAPGFRRYEAVLEPLPAETARPGDRRAFWIEVEERKANVLYLEGRPRWEFRRLRDLWERDPGVELEVLLAEDPARDRGRVEEALAGAAGKDLLVLGDLAPELVSPRALERIRDFVTRGGTVFFIGGAHHTALEWPPSPLATLLPVELSAAGGGGAEAPLGGFPWRLADAGSAAPFLRLLPSAADSARLWSLLPRAAWAAPVLRALPGSRILLETEAAGGSRFPLLVLRPHGRGRVLFLGTDATWRWRRGTGDAVHEAFWRGAARWAAGSRWIPAGRHALARAEPRVAAPEATVLLETYFEPPPGGAAGAPPADLIIEKESGGGRPSVRLPLAQVQGVPGRFAAQVRAAELAAELGLVPAAEETRASVPVPVHARVEGPGSAESSESAPGGERSGSPLLFRLVPPGGGEEDDIRADRELLSELAGLSGGAVLTLEELGKAAAHLRDRSRTRTEREESGPGDHPLACALAVALLLGLDWVLRMQSG